MCSVDSMYCGGMSALMIDIGDCAGLWDVATKFTKDGAYEVYLLKKHTQESGLVKLHDDTPTL